MFQFFTLLRELKGTYKGLGINHESLPFTGTFRLTETIKDKCFTLDFKAVGEQGEAYHQEHSLLGITARGGFSLFEMSNNHPGVLEHTFFECAPIAGATHTLSFKAGEVENKNDWREIISLDLWPTGELTYRFAWGMPGGEFKDRSSVKMKSGFDRPIVQAKLVQTPEGKKPQGEGWYVLNAKEAVWSKNEKFGESCGFEGDVRFEQYGMNIHTIYPGQPNCHYHGEDDQEDFLVIDGECLLLIEGQELKLKKWDFVHCPKWARHVFVGTGDQPCTLVMVGGRTGDGVQYPVLPLTNKYNASPERETRSPKESYSQSPNWVKGISPDWI